MTELVTVNGQAVDLSRTSLPTLGYTVMMSFRDVEVTRGQLAQMMEDAGLAEYVPDDPTSKATLRLAVGKWVAKKLGSRLGAEVGKRIGIKVVNSSDNRILTYVVTVEQSDRKRLSIALNTEMRVFLWKATDEIRVTLTSTGGTDDDVREEVALTNELGAIWKELRGTLASRTVRELLCDLCMAEGGIREYPGAAIFFLPNAREQVVMGLRQLGAALVAAKQDVTIKLRPLVNDALAREEMAASAQDALLDEIDVLRDEIGKSATRQNGARTDTIVKRLQDVAALRAKVQEYADLLDLRTERLDGELGDLETRARAITTADAVRAAREAEAPTQLVIPAGLADDTREERED